jgi:predicted dehydrogenase
VFCEKPFALTRSDAEAAVDAVRKAGVTLGLGYNRRFHPEMTRLRDRIRSGELGTVMHVEATMTFPNALLLKPTQWRANREETPCGGLTPMGVHAIDGMIDLCGEIDHVFCQSFRRVVEIDSDDTTSVLLRMKDGTSGYLGTVTATGPGFSFQVFGSKGWVRLEGMTHVAGASSEERRTRLFGACKFQPAKGNAEVWQAETCDVTRACLEAFARAASGGPEFPIPVSQMIHGAAVTEAIVRSAASGQVERVG